MGATTRLRDLGDQMTTYNVVVPLPKSDRERLLTGAQLRDLASCTDDELLKQTAASFGFALSLQGLNDFLSATEAALESTPKKETNAQPLRLRLSDDAWLRVFRDDIEYVKSPKTLNTAPAAVPPPNVGVLMTAQRWAKTTPTDQLQAGPLKTLLANRFAKVPLALWDDEAFVARLLNSPISATAYFRATERVRDRLAAVAMRDPKVSWSDVPKTRQTDVELARVALRTDAGRFMAMPPTLWDDPTLRELATPGPLDSPELARAMTAAVAPRYACATAEDLAFTLATLRTAPEIIETLVTQGLTPKSVLCSLPVVKAIAESPDPWLIAVLPTFPRTVDDATAIAVAKLSLFSSRSGLLLFEDDVTERIAARLVEEEPRAMLCLPENLANRKDVVAAFMTAPGHDDVDVGDEGAELLLSPYAKWFCRQHPEQAMRWLTLRCRGDIAQLLAWIPAASDAMAPPIVAKLRELLQKRPGDFETLRRELITAGFWHVQRVETIDELRGILADGYAPPEDTRPVIVIAAARHDWNGAFDSPIPVQLWRDAGYRVVYREIDRKDGLRKAIAARGGDLSKPIKVELAGHGTIGSIQFGRGKDGTLSLRDETLIRELSDVIPAGSDVYLHSCSTGAGRENAANMANALSLALPRRGVHAPVIDGHTEVILPLLHDQPAEYSMYGFLDPAPYETYRDGDGTL